MITTVRLPVWIGRKMSGSQLIGNPTEYKQEYEQILNSRAKYGRQEFEELSSEYIQDDAVAEDMVSWIVNKTMRPRQLLGVNVFGMSQIQLGDILTVRLSGYSYRSN